MKKKKKKPDLISPLYPPPPPFRQNQKQKEGRMVISIYANLTALLSGSYIFHRFLSY